MIDFHFPAFFVAAVREQRRAKKLVNCNREWKEFLKREIANGITNLYSFYLARVCLTSRIITTRRAQLSPPQKFEWKKFPCCAHRDSYQSWYEQCSLQAWRMNMKGALCTWGGGLRGDKTRNVAKSFVVWATSSARENGGEEKEKWKMFYNAAHPIESV